MGGGFWMDERAEHINGRISFFVLMLTHAGVALLIAYKRYIQGLDTAYYNGFNVILLMSILGYWGLRLYFSGILPVISIRRLALIYVGVVLLIEILAFLIAGRPTPWYEALYPVLGVAAVMALYALIAYMGKRRLQKYLNE